MTNIRGKHVLLTGGSRGLGPVIAEALARQGAHLALAARSAQDLQLVASKLEELGTKVITIPVDLAFAGLDHSIITLGVPYTYSLPPAGATFALTARARANFLPIVPAGVFLRR